MAGIDYCNKSLRANILSDKFCPGVHLPLSYEYTLLMVQMGIFVFDCLSPNLDEPQPPDSRHISANYMSSFETRKTTTPDPCNMQYTSTHFIPLSYVARGPILLRANPFPKSFTASNNAVSVLSSSPAINRLEPPPNDWITS
jgi:hypothetical protein